MTTIDPTFKPAMRAWLLEAAEGIDISPDPNDPFPPRWRVEVNNGLGGHAGMGSVIAVCPNMLEAELVAAALWALKRETFDERAGRGS